ncbi:MAG: DUF4331 family protein [Fimbriimonadaceae bacterium]
MKWPIKLAAVTAPLVAVGAGLLLIPAFASDHADTLETAGNPGRDLSDVYIFPSTQNPNNVVLVMCVNPLIASGGGPAARFDPNVLYQFKIDRDEDSVEDLVIQAKFDNSPNQVVQIAGPVKPSSVGTTTNFETPYATTGTINTQFSPTPGMTVFAGAREDPFFFDLERFFEIFPDRGVPTGLTTPPADPNQPMQTSWRAPGQAVDFLSNGGFNVLAIVVELPKAMLK